MAKMNDASESALQERMSLNQEERQEAAKLNRRLEFGHTFKATYKKHGFHGVKDIFWNSNSKAYVSYNEKSIHVWNPFTSEQLYSCQFFEETKSHTISTMVYSKRHWLYFVISTDFNIHVFNEHLILIRQLPLKIRLVQYVYFLEDQNMLITAGVDGCFLFQLDIEYRHHPKQNIVLDPTGKMTQLRLSIVEKLPDCPAWNKGLKYYEDSKTLILWSTQELSIYTIPQNIVTGVGGDGIVHERNTKDEFTFDIWFHFKNLMPPDDVCLDVLFNRKLLTFVMGSQQGTLTVWKCGTENNCVHTFDPVGKPITSLQSHPREPLYFISASLDSVIRVYDLTKYLHIYSFEIDQVVKYIKLIDTHLFACYFDNGHLKTGQIDNIANLFLTRQQVVRSVGKMFKQIQQRDNNKPNLVYSLYRDNSIQFQKPKEKNMEVISTVYPPPGATEIAQVIQCASRNEILLLTEEGSICIYRLDHITGTLVKVLKAPQIMDAKGQRVMQTITSMVITWIEPPRFDCNHSRADVDRFYDKKEDDSLSSDSFKTDMSLEIEDRWLGLGLSKGNVIFLQMPDYERLYSRFSIEKKEAIVKFLIMPARELMLTINTIHELKIWGFNKAQQEMYQTFNLYRPIQDIQMHGRIMLFGFEQGDTELFIWDYTDPAKSAEAQAIHIDRGESKDYSKMNKQSALFKLPNSKLDEHFGGLGGIDFHPKLEIFVSGGPDATVKIFNIKKEILKEIKFPQPVTGVIFKNPEGDLMISHEEKVSVVRYQDLQMPNIETVLEINDVKHFVSMRKPVDWKIFAKMKLYVDSLNEKGPVDLYLEKLVEEEEDKEYNKRIDGLAIEKKISFIDQGAIDLDDLNVALDKEQIARKKKQEEFNQKKEIKEKVQTLPPEIAYDKMADIIVEEQVAAIQKEIDDKKEVKVQKKRVRSKIEREQSIAPEEAKDSKKISVTSSAQKLSVVTNETNQRLTEEASVAEEVNRDSGSKPNTESKGVAEKKLKMMNLRAKALRESIAAGKAVLEQAARNKQDLLPANTETLPPTDVNSRIGSIIEASVNFGFTSQQSTLQQSMHQISVLNKLNKKPLVSRQDLTSLRIAENIRLYNNPSINASHNNIFITTNNEQGMLQTQASKNSLQNSNTYIKGRKHIRSSTLSAMSGKTSHVGQTLPQDYESTKSSNFLIKRNLKQNKLRKSQPHVIKTNVMVDTQSFQEVVPENQSESQIGLTAHELPVTQDGRAEQLRETTPHESIVLSGLMESQQDAAFKRSLERAISESSHFRKRSTNRKLPAIPHAQHNDRVFRKNQKFQQNRMYQSVTPAIETNDLNYEANAFNSYMPDRIPTKPERKTHHLSRSIQNESIHSRHRSNKSHSVSKMNDLTRENITRNSREMHELRKSHDMASSRERKLENGEPELYVSNQFNTGSKNSSGFQATKPKVQHTTSLKIRLKQNQPQQYQEYLGNDLKIPSRSGHHTKNMNTNSMSTFHRVSQEQLPNTQETNANKDSPNLDTGVNIDKRNIVGQAEASYNYQETQNVLNKNKMIQLISHKNGEAKQVQQTHLLALQKEDSNVVSPHDHPSKPVYRQK